MSIPDLLLQLCNSVSQQPSLQQEHRGTCYRILLGLHEVDWDEVEDTDRQHLNAGWIQEALFGLKQKGWEKESQQLRDLFAEFGRCTRSGPARPDAGSSSETFTEQQAVLSLLLHLRGSVPRPLAPHHVARLPLPLQLGVDPVLLPPSHHGNALFFGCLSQSDAQPAVSIPQMLQAPPFEQPPQPWALAGRGQPQDELQPGVEGEGPAPSGLPASFKDMLVGMDAEPAWTLSGEGKDDGTPPQAGGNMSGVPDGLAEQALLLQERLEGLQDSVLFAPENAGTTRRQAQPTQVRAEPSMDELNMLSLRMPLLGQDDSESLADGSTYSLATSGYGAQGHQANSLRSSEEFPADKENQQVLPQQQQPDAQKQGSRVPGLELLSDEQLALEAVYALQGVGPAMTLLQSGRVSTPTMGATCLRSLLRGVVVAGKRRQLLEAFMAAFGVRCGADSVGHEHQDPTLQAFAEAVQQILRRHSRALQELPGSVAARREAEADSSLSRFLGSVGAQTCPSAGQTPMTALEVVAHTQHLQEQLQLLCSICWCTTNSSSAASKLWESTHESADAGLEMAGCRWVQEGFLRGADLLSHLHAQLQDADTEAAPILRFLLLATVQPYLGHMRSWLQSTTPVQSGFAAMPATGLQAVSRAEVSRTDDFEEQAQPGVPPAFLAPVHRQFLLAGQQLRILDHHSSARALVQRMATLAATEAAEARAAARAAGDDWAEAGLGSEEQSTASLAGQPTWQWCGAQADPGYVLAFKSSALEQIRHVQRRTCAERAVKVQRLLDSWQQQRAQQEANAADCREAVAVATQQKREAERLQKEGDAASKRQQREALLQEQKAAMGAADAARETKRLQRIRAEQDTLHAEAQVEHAAAMSAVQAAMHNSRQEVADLQKQAAHVAWRAERWELAGARRRTLQAQEAADRAELTALAKTSQQAHADTTPQTPALEQADEVTSAQDQANEAGVTPSSTLPPEADGAGAPEAAPASTRQLPPQAAARPAPELRPDSGLPHAAVAAPGAAQIPPTEVAVDDIQLQLFKGGVAELPAAPYNSRPEEAPAKATALGLQEGRPAGAELHAALATCRAERTVGSCSSDAAPANADALELPLGQAGLQAPQEAQPDRAALASFFVDARSDSTDSAESWQDAGEQLAPEAEQGLPSASAGAEEGLQGAAAHVGPAEVPAAGAYRPVAWGLQSSSSGPSKDQQVVAAQVDPDVSRDSAQDTEQQLTPELAQGLQADSFRAGGRGQAATPPVDPAMLPAAGAYRAVAWGPVQQPFAAAGQTRQRPSGGNSGDAPSAAAARAAGSEGTGATRGGSDGSLTPQEEAGVRNQGAGPSSAREGAAGLGRAQADAADQPAAGQYRPVAWAPEQRQSTGDSQAAAPPTSPELGQQAAACGPLEHSATQAGTGLAQPAGASSIEAAAAQSGGSHPGAEGRPAAGLRVARWGPVQQPFGAAGQAAQQEAQPSGQDTAWPRAQLQSVQSDSPPVQAGTAEALVHHARAHWELEPSAKDLPHTGMAMQAEDEGTEEALEPLPVVLDACIISSLLDQYRCISRACMGLLLKELRLLDLLGALRRYFFMEAGDWAGALTEGLCRHTAEGGDLQEHALQDALADALRGSSCEGDMYTERLGVQLCEGAPAVQAAGHKREPAGSTPGGSMLSPIRMRAASPAGSSGAMHTRPRPGLIGGIRVHDDKLTALDTVQLTFQVDWPLSAVVTEESLQSYGAIFSMLLRLKRVAHLLAALWGDLLPLKGPTSRQTPQQSPGTGARGSDPSASSKKPGGGGRGGEAGPQPAWVQQRLQALQLFRHEAAHFLGAVQAYMHSQLLGACWQRFQQRVEAEVVDISELHDAHQEYLRSAMQECLLSPDKRELRGVIEPALQRILDFRATLGRLRAQKEEDVAAVVRDDVAWTALQKCMQELQTRTRMLYKVLKFVAGRGHLRPLFLQLDLNQFYAQQQ